MKTIQVQVKPGARISVLEETSSGVWLARLKSLPIDGKANEELVFLDRQALRLQQVGRIHQERRLRTHETGSYRKQLRNTLVRDVRCRPLFELGYRGVAIGATVACRTWLVLG